jgi:hypothetical protein
MSNKDTNANGPQGQEPEVEILDVEEFAKTNGGKPPKARRYKIRVDRVHFTVDVPHMTGKEILVLAGKTPPERYLLNQKFKHGQVVPVGLNHNADFTAPGVERFITLPKDQTEGRGTLRQHFKLPEEDVCQLEAAGRDWETVPENWLVVHDFPVPEGYNVTSVSVALRIPTNYPTAPLDMAYFCPALQLASGRGIPAVSAGQQIDGKGWQQWSRHYTPQNPWVPGEYNVSTHLALVNTWLERELTRN